KLFPLGGLERRVPALVLLLNCHRTLASRVGIHFRNGSYFAPAGSTMEEKKRQPEWTRWLPAHGGAQRPPAAAFCRRASSDQRGTLVATWGNLGQPVASFGSR